MRLLNVDLWIATSWIMRLESLFMENRILKYAKLSISYRESESAAQLVILNELPSSYSLR